MSEQKRPSKSKRLWKAEAVKAQRDATLCELLLAQREAQLAALREKVQGVYELVMLFDHEAVYDLKNDILAVLSGRWEERDAEERRGPNEQARREDLQEQMRKGQL